MAFTGFHLHPTLLKGLKDMGFVRPTPIQAEAIPPAMARRDVLACAMTGSGKTAAFLLPIAHHLIARPRGATRALILTPTRELAAQILEDLNDLAVHTPITGASVYGGVGMGPQEHAFRSGVDVLVATPGRLLDHFRYSYGKLPALEYLVLDEADRMLDMGFLPDIKRILRHVPAKRQTLFFSATMPAPIALLSREMLHDPVTINLQRDSRPAVGITQAVYPVRQDLKPALLVTLLERGEVRDALVFTRTKHRADRLARHLVRSGVEAERIHGDRSQPQRTAALAGFKKRRFRVLVATDVAARGIDIEALGHVINFDVPKSPDDYIHRVGRTARAELTGDAFTFVARDEEADLRAIEKTIGKRLPRVMVPDFDYDAAAPEMPRERAPARRPAGPRDGRRPGPRASASDGRHGGSRGVRGTGPSPRGGRPSGGTRGVESESRKSPSRVTFRGASAETSFAGGRNKDARSRRPGRRRAPRR